MTNFLEAADVAPDAFVQVPFNANIEVSDLGIRMWQQVDRIVRTALGHSGMRQRGAETYQPNEFFGRTPFETGAAHRIMVAPGIVMSSDEYQERFQDIDLEQVRKRMNPEIFKAFVRYMGLIPGDPRVNIAQISSIPD
jgi:hypothetical protein